MTATEFQTVDSGNLPEFKSKSTLYVIICYFIAACGGLMFGYDIGISGGVTSMDDFLEKFFPTVYRRKLQVHEDNYCKYDNQYLQLFTSSLYLAALLSSFVASKVCSILGRRPAMMLGSIFFLIGAILNAAAENLLMLILGRILLGIGVGFCNEAVPLYLSEVAPVKVRGAVNIMFQLFVTIGIFIANLVNYFTSKMHPSGWRVSLGIAGVPASVLLLGSFFITETPTSLIQRQQLEKGKATLEKVRGVVDVDAEFDQIVIAAEKAQQVKHPFRKLMSRSNRPPLVIGILLQVFQQLTGINAIMFYAPVLFQSVGFKNDASLFSSVITGLVNVLSTIVSIVLVDRCGRRVLLLEACVQMLIAQSIIGGLLEAHLKTYADTLGRGESFVVVFLVCFYVMGFAWSWGPLGWLIPSETFPVETRTAGFAFAVSSNMLFTFVIAQAFLSMLCRMRAAIFFFFAGWIVVMGLFVLFLLPETKKVPIDVMVDRVWKKHWYWKRFMMGDGDDDDKHRNVELGL